MLRGFEEKEFPYSKYDALEMLDKLLDKELIELPQTRCPEEIRTRDPKNYKYHMINSHPSVTFSAVLTGIIVTSEYLAACQLDVWARPMHLVFQSDHGRARQQLLHSANVPASVHNHIRFARQE